VAADVVRYPIDAMSLNDGSNFLKQPSDETPSHYERLTSVESQVTTPGVYSENPVQPPVFTVL
jgi:hypothetical protein